MSENANWNQNSQTYQAKGFSEANNYEDNAVENLKQSHLPNAQQKVNDVFFSILYFLSLGAVIGCSIYFGKYLPQLGGGGSNNGLYSLFDPIKGSLLLVAAVIGIVTLFAIVLTNVFIILMRKHPRNTINVCYIGSIAVSGLVAVYGIIVQNYGLAIGNGIVFLLSIVCYFLIRRRIPFTAALLKACCVAYEKYPFMSLITFASALISLGVTALFIYCMMSIAAYVEVNNVQEKAGLNIGVFFLVLFLFWSTEILANVVHTIISGIYAWFFLVEKGTTGTGQSTMSPSAVVGNSIKRTLVYSLGSICCASLIVATIQAIRVVLSSLKNDRSRDNGARLVAACADCLLSIVEKIVKFVNYYIFIMMAIFGTSFMQSAKKTVKLFREDLGTVLINENVIGQVLFFGNLLMSMLCAALAFGLSMIMIKDQLASIVTAVISIVVSFMVLFVMSSVLSSGTNTAIVCYTIDPTSIEDPTFQYQIRKKMGRFNA